MLMKYVVRVRTEKSPVLLSGKRELEQENRIVLPLPEGHIESVTAAVRVELAEKEKIFMNGFQTWTYCPEYMQTDRIRSLSHLPKRGIAHFGLDRYGDNYFVSYPNAAGVTHGESWCYFRDGDRFRLLASLDEKNGYTLFRYDVSTRTLKITRDCEGLRCGGDFAALELFYAEGSEDEVFDAWFAAMNIRPRTTRPVKGYTSWYNRYQRISEKSIRQDLSGCERVLERGDLFQIDDGWEPFVGDWLETDSDKFPQGLAGIADDIHAKGFTAGLWLAPFICERKSSIYREHPDWLCRHEGEPWYCGSNWSGFYSLDIDNPEVVSYLREIFRRVFEEWHFDLVKLDFLYAAAPFGSETESRAGRMLRAMELLRELCGEHLILGCGVPVMPAFGLVDYCRISCDVGLDWDGSWIMRQTNRERVSTRQAIGNTVFRRQLNGRAYLSDPDVFFLRDHNLLLTPAQKEVLAKVNHLLGGMVLTSDDMTRYDDGKIARYRKLQSLRRAENIRVHADENLKISYDLDGKREEFTIE